MSILIGGLMICIGAGLVVGLVLFPALLLSGYISECEERQDLAVKGSDDDQG